VFLKGAWPSRSTTLVDELALPMRDPRSFLGQQLPYVQQFF
jgi:hypothetical protein